MPFGEVPAEPLLPEFGEPEFGFDEPGFEEPVVPAVPGMEPHGEPLGLVPGVFEVLGFTVDGEVLVPGVAGLVEFDPGTPDGELGVALPACGVAVPLLGVAVLLGGVAE